MKFRGPEALNDIYKKHRARGGRTNRNPLEEQILTHVLSASYGSSVPLFDPPIEGPLLRRISIRGSTAAEEPLPTAVEPVYPDGARQRTSCSPPGASREVIKLPFLFLLRLKTDN